MKTLINYTWKKRQTDRQTERQAEGQPYSRQYDEESATKTRQKGTAKKNVEIA